jgi:hypothetical protein
MEEVRQRERNGVCDAVQYIIDPKISDLVSKELKSNCILVFDEAHNIGTLSPLPQRANRWCYITRCG